MARSTPLSLPNVPKISSTCFAVTLRVSLPTCSRVVLKSAARPPSMPLPLAALPSSAGFAASAAFAAEEGFAANFGAFGASLPAAATASERRFEGSLLPLAPFASATFAGGSELVLHTPRKFVFVLTAFDSKAANTVGEARPPC